MYNVITDEVLTIEIIEEDSFVISMALTAIFELLAPPQQVFSRRIYTYIQRISTTYLKDLPQQSVSLKGKFSRATVSDLFYLLKIDDLTFLKVLFFVKC